ncbi:Uncharacterised protein [Vibrio cholerae]|nr:Uncharacterised protein [Vibrio cholerae]
MVAATGKSGCGRTARGKQSIAHRLGGKPRRVNDLSLIDAAELEDFFYPLSDFL